MNRNQVGDFLLEGKLHTGRMTEVWKARWLKATDERWAGVALKLLRVDQVYDLVGQARFINEIEALRTLRHPLIPPLLAMGTLPAPDGRFYMAMHYVEGLPLRRYLGQQVQPVFVAQLLAKLAGALDYVHSKGIVHRDIKPENVMVGGQWDPYLIDFNVALSREAKRVTTVGELVGSTHYMAPELIHSDPIPGQPAPVISPQADVYSLATMAFEMLTGQLPYSGNTYQVTYQHLYNPIPSAVALNPALPVAVDAVIAKGMAKRPQDRQRRASAFVGDLQRALGLPVTVQASGPTGETMLPIIVGGIVAVTFLVMLVLINS